MFLSDRVFIVQIGNRSCSPKKARTALADIPITSTACLKTSSESESKIICSLISEEVIWAFVLTPLNLMCCLARALFTRALTVAEDSLLLPESYRDNEEPVLQCAYRFGLEEVLRFYLDSDLFEFGSQSNACQDVQDTRKGMDSWQLCT